MSKDGEMHSRTRPGDVPALVVGEVMPPSALADVLDGRPLYGVAPDAAPTIAQRIADLEAATGAQDRAHRALEGVVDQLTAQVQELRRQLGMDDWRPEYRSDRP